MDSKGVVAGRFELGRLIGAGGMGSVYKAWDRAAGRTVAVKLVKDAADRARFEREAEVLEALDHPGIVRYVAHGEAEGRGAFIAMEWVEGESVAARLDRVHQLASADAVRLCRRVAEALGAAHALGVIHRDLKPANVLLVDGSIDRPKIVDFGIARGSPEAEAVASSQKDLTAEGEIIGTPGYMPPEQMRPGGVPTPASDVYGLGCILFRAIAGRRPFEGDTAIELLQQAARVDAPRLSSIVDGVPPELDDLVARMLAREAADRPADAARAAEALAALAPRDAPASLGSASPTEVGRAAPDRGEGALFGRGALVVGAVLAAAAIAFVIYRLSAGGSKIPEPSASASASAAPRAEGPCTLDGVAFEICKPIPADFPRDLSRALGPLEERAKAIDVSAILTRVPWTPVFGGLFDPDVPPAERFVFRTRKDDGQVGEIHIALEAGSFMIRRASTPGGNAPLVPPPCTARELLDRAISTGALDGTSPVEMSYEGLRGGAVWNVRSNGRTVQLNGTSCALLSPAGGPE